MTEVLVEHDLGEGELVRSLAGLAGAEGVGAPLLEALAKAEADGHAGRIPRERWMSELVGDLEAAYRRQIDHLGVNLMRWVDGLFPGRGAWQLRKARPGLMLTHPQLEELRRLIAAHFRVEAPGAPPVAWSIPEPVWREWQQAGIVVPWLPVPQIADSYLAGRLYQVIRDGDTYAHMLALARRAPLTRPMRLAVEWAEAHAAQYIAGFGDQLAGQAGQQALTVQQQLGRGLIVRYLKGELTAVAPPPGPPHNLLPEERAALETDRAVASWRALARELYQTFKGTDARRDWHRVAASETRLAHNVGRLHAMEEQGVRALYYLVQPDACGPCKRLYLEEDGVTPRVFPLSTLLANLDLTGGLNVGRKASLIGQDGGWIATGGLLHPWDRCRPMPALPGRPPTSLQPVSLHG